LRGWVQRTGGRTGRGNEGKNLTWRERGEKEVSVWVNGGTGDPVVTNGESENEERILSTFTPITREKPLKTRTYQ